MVKCGFCHEHHVDVTWVIMCGYQHRNYTKKQTAWMLERHRGAVKLDQTTSSQTGRQENGGQIG